MTTHPMNPVRSEKGVALIIVLLLLAVMAGLTTGLTLNGQTEIAMAHNEIYYAGARAAAEAGMNRAIEQIIGDITTDLIADEGRFRTSATVRSLSPTSIRTASSSSTTTIRCSMARP